MSEGPFTFEDVAKPVMINSFEHVGVWTDGVVLTSDNLGLCELPMEVGVKYRVTVERID
jgi:hypothetical protein